MFLKSTHLPTYHFNVFNVLISIGSHSSVNVTQKCIEVQIFEYSNNSCTFTLSFHRFLSQFDVNITNKPLSGVEAEIQTKPIPLCSYIKVSADKEEDIDHHLP